MRKIFVLLFSLSVVAATAQERKSENLILVTLDGFRWQELFNGADSLLLFNKSYTTDPASAGLYWKSDANERKRVLLPFFWSTIDSMGQIYGNRYHGNYVNCANPYWFSYPGYSELLTGIVDRKMASNRKVVNRNINVFEYLHQQSGYEGKVAAFSTWDVIPYVIRASSNGIITNEARSMHSDTTKITNSERSDESTFTQAFDYLMQAKPKVLFLSLDGTDHHAHAGRYSDYLNYAHLADSMINSLWQWVQSEEGYRDKTTIIITTDHGRGRNAKWKTHGRWAFGSSETWFAVLGPDTPPRGEMKTKGHFYQKQLAKTMGAFLELDYNHPTRTTGEVIQQMFYPINTIVVR